MKLLPLALGVGVLSLVVASPVAHLDHHLLTAHMAQHLMLTLLAAPLVLLGAPSILTRWRPHPAFCWLAGTLTVIVWHVPEVFELALRSHFWHEFEQASFFVAGSLFWWPVIRPGRVLLAQAGRFRSTFFSRHCRAMRFQHFWFFAAMSCIRITPWEPAILGCLHSKIRNWRGR